MSKLPGLYNIIVQSNPLYTSCSPKRDWLMDRQGSAQDLNTSRFLNFAADEVCYITGTLATHPKSIFSMDRAEVSLFVM